jgi:hypothetical protein
MDEKAAVLHDADVAFTELRQSIAGLGDEPMSRVMLGTWDTRDILIHISGWHREMIPALDRIARGESEPYPAGTYDDYDTWNARFVAAKVGVKPADVVAELEMSHRDFVAAAAAVPPQYFGGDGAARGLIDGVGPAHYREHATQIRTWRDSIGV